MPTRLFSLIRRNRYTAVLLVLVAVPLLTGFQAVYGAGDSPDDCGCGKSDTGAVGGLVVDSVTGKPIVGAVTTIATTPPQTAESDETGVGFTHLRFGEYNVSATKAGYSPNFVVAQVNGDGGFTEIKIVLVPLPSSLKGKVTDVKTNAPIVNAGVSLNGTGISTRIAATDGTGSYQFPSPPTGISLTMRATADKYDPKDQTAVTVNPGEDKVVDFALNPAAGPPPAPTGAVSVTLLDATTANKLPLSAINSVTWNNAPMTLNTSTGTFSLNNAAAGNNNTLAVAATGYAPVTRSGIKLDANGNLSFTIPDSANFPTNAAAPVCESTAKSYRITLDWQRDTQRRPDDLDLLLVVPRAGSTVGCFLDNDVRGNLCSAPNAQLRVENTHIASDPPVESVDIAQLNPGTYMVVVHDWGGEVDHKNTATFLGDPKTAATVTIYGPKGAISATAPVGPAGGYWYWIPFTINGSTGEVTPMLQNNFLPIGTAFTPQECPF
jgi:hypothetical protein